MIIKAFNHLPDEAKSIRLAVFVEEQGFAVEFDETDKIATHIVAFENSGVPFGVCRIFPSDEKGVFIFGRLCILPQYRRCGLGTKILSAAENEAKALGASRLILHAQCRATAFYEKSGYIPYGDIEPDEGVPHIWMGKNL